MVTKPFTPTPFPYQLHGACQAAWHGHTLIADEMGLGKTLQALLVARLIGAQRVLIICPPILVANWEKETRRTGNLETIDGENVTITAGSKNPEQLPDVGYVIASDAIVSSRRALDPLLDTWGADLLIVDEAHRFKNHSTRRTKAVLRIAKTVDRSILLTGTPIVSSPLDVLPLLRILDKLEAIAPSGRAFIDEYTVPAPWKGGRLPIKSKLPQLHALLEQHVWTRRNKTDVLADLPAKLRTVHHVTPDGTDLKQANADVTEKIDAWLDKHPTPDENDITSFVGDAMPFVSQLRKATGVAKIPAATDWITRHLDEPPGQPLIVWTIHRDVTTQLAAQLATERPEAAVRVLDGATTHPERSEAVEAFQAGQVDVLIAQIVAAGVGLTLTRGSTALFVETDWTPANVAQAEDRQHRIGQTRPVHVTTLIAEGTLDARIHAVLGRTIDVLDDLTPGSDHRVSRISASGSTGPREIIRQLITERIHHRQENPS